MPLSNVNGVELYWERTGIGPRLLFCNGSGSTIVDARPLIDALAAEFDLLTWDYRGLGRSGPVTDGYEMGDVAGDALALLDHVGWSSASVVGMSFGGMVAQELTVRVPERIERLALLCSSAGGGGGASYPLHSLLALPAAERAAVGLSLTDSRWSERWLTEHPGDRMLAERLARREDPAGSVGGQAQLTARADHDVWDRLESVSCPTLVAYGRYDGIAPPENSAAIASRIPGADLRGYDGGHLFLVQDPTALPELVAFLRA